MIKLLPQWLKAQQKVQGCAVIVGNDIQALSPLFSPNIPVYQLQHDVTQTQSQLEVQAQRLIRVRLNLLDAAALKALYGRFRNQGILSIYAFFSLTLCSLKIAMHGPLNSLRTIGKTQA